MREQALGHDGEEHVVAEAIHARQVESTKTRKLLGDRITVREGKKMREKKNRRKEERRTKKNGGGGEESERAQKDE